MGKTTKKSKKSVYRLAREELNLSRAAATKFMPDDENFPGMSYIDEHRLVKLENGTTSIQPADVVVMAKRYNKPELRNYYCCNDCPIGKIDTPEVINADNIHQILVNMAVSLKNVNHKKIRLMEILEDGKVDPGETEDYEKIYGELEHISAIIEALQLWCERMKLGIK